MGFGGECGNSRAARADGTHARVWDRRFEHLARMERDWAAHTTPVETADAANLKGMHRPKDSSCAAEARRRRGINVTAGPCGRSNAESARRRRGPSSMGKNRTLSGQVQTGFFFWVLEHPETIVFFSVE